MQGINSYTLFHLTYMLSQAHTHNTTHTHCKVSKGVHRGALRSGTSQEQAHLQIVCHALFQQCNLG
jgi:hypothetical protein